MHYKLQLFLCGCTLYVAAQVIVWDLKSRVECTERLGTVRFSATSDDLKALLEKTHGFQGKVLHQVLKIPDYLHSSSISCVFIYLCLGQTFFFYIQSG
jgi:hypothetical protein